MSVCLGGDVEQEGKVVPHVPSVHPRMPGVHVAVAKRGRRRTESHRGASLSAPGDVPKSIEARLWRKADWWANLPEPAHRSTVVDPAPSTSIIGPILSHRSQHDAR